jgi:hypothetical protein
MWQPQFDNVLLSNIGLFSRLNKKYHQELTLLIVISGTLIFFPTFYPTTTAYGANNLIALSDQIITQQGTAIPITLKVNGTDTLNNKLTFSFSLPRNGTLLGTAPNLLYTPNANFQGIDSFTFIAHGPTLDSNNATIKIMVNPFGAHPIIPEPLLRSIAAFSISFAIVIGIIFIVRWIIVRYKSPVYPQHKSRFSDIIRTADWDPSLSIFQFLLWTIIVLFSFFGIWLTRIFGGITIPVQGGIPTNLLAIMGISVVVPFVSNYLTNVKQIPPPQEPIGLSAMLNEYDKPALSRFQMFAWTWIGIIIYLLTLFSSVRSFGPVQNLVLPDVDSTLVLLMGLSQVAFLGGKATSLQPTAPPPTVNDKPVETKTGTAIDIALEGAAPDPSDKLTFSIVVPPKQGKLANIQSTGPSTSTVNYTPNSGFTGIDSFTYKATITKDNKQTDSNIATVTITVTVP